MLRVDVLHCNHDRSRCCRKGKIQPLLLEGVCIVAGRGGFGRCCHGFVEYAVKNNAAAGREDVVRAF